MDVSLSMPPVQQRAFQRLASDAETHSNIRNTAISALFSVIEHPNTLSIPWDTDVPHFCGGDREPLPAKAMRRTHAGRHFCPIGRFCPVITCETLSNYHSTVDIHRNGTVLFRQNIHIDKEKNSITSDDMRQRGIQKKERRIR